MDGCWWDPASNQVVKQLLKLVEHHKFKKKISDPSGHSAEVLMPKRSLLCTIISMILLIWVSQWSLS